MPVNHNARHLLDDLLTHPFTPVTTKPWSHVALFKEYARRMAWWADRIGAVNNWLTTNIVYVLELDDGLDVTSLQRLDTHLQNLPLYQPMPAILQSALMFAMVSNHPAIKQYDLENPYDAIVKLYLRNGFFRWNERGFWEISGAFGVDGIDLHTYMITKPFVSLDDEELDLIDNGDKETFTPDL